jgi:hypothetical protein
MFSVLHCIKIRPMIAPMNLHHEQPEVTPYAASVFVRAESAAPRILVTKEHLKSLIVDCFFAQEYY